MVPAPKAIEKPIKTASKKLPDRPIRLKAPRTRSARIAYKKVCHEVDGKQTPIFRHPPRSESLLYLDTLLFLEKVTKEARKEIGGHRALTPAVIRAAASSVLYDLDPMLHNKAADKEPAWTSNHGEGEAGPAVSDEEEEEDLFID